MFDDVEEPPGGGWDTAAGFFAHAVERGDLIPTVIAITVHGERSAAARAFATSGRVGETANSPDRMVRARLAVGLIALTRDRVTDELAAAGVVPA